MRHPRPDICILEMQEQHCFNYLFARSQNGKFIIRIEDTDQKRNVEGGEQSQLYYLKWLGIDWDESIDQGGEYGPYRQMERLDLYKHYTNELIGRGLAYNCYCTEEELAQNEKTSLREERPLNIQGNAAI